MLNEFTLLWQQTRQRFQHSSVSRSGGVNEREGTNIRRWQMDFTEEKLVWVLSFLCCGVTEEKQTQVNIRCRNKKRDYWNTVRSFLMGNNLNTADLFCHMNIYWSHSLNRGKIQSFCVFPECRSVNETVWKHKQSFKMTDSISAAMPLKREEIQKQRADGKRSPQKRRAESMSALMRLFDVINFRAIIDFFSQMLGIIRTWQSLCWLHLVG